MVAAGLALVAASPLRSLDIYISGLPNRVLANVSLGLDHDLEAFGHQCSVNGTRRFPQSASSMGYTPNRRLQSQTVSLAKEGFIQLGFVLALGAHSNQYYDYGPGGSLNGIMAVWDSWVDNFFSRTSNTSSLVLLFDERDFLRQNDTRVVAEYIDSIVVRNMGATPVDCVHAHRGSGGGGGGVHQRRHPSTARKAPHGCRNEVQLDQGYRVYYLDVASAASPELLPFIIFAGVHRFPAPAWAQGQDEETLFVHWRPSRIGRFKTNYGYVKMTNWYSYHLLGLRVLDFFDYGGKLDNDVSFVGAFPEPNLPLRMAVAGSKMISTDRGWYCDDWRIAQGCRLALNSWIDLEQTRCGKVQLRPGGHDTVLFEGNLNLTIRSHFITYWLGLYDAPETKALARHWNEFHPRGMWDYRWGDQQWWTRPIAMFSDGNVARDIEHYYELNSTDGDGDGGKYIQHKLWPLTLTVSQTQYFNLSGSTRQIRRQNYEATIKKLCKTNKYVQCPRS